MPCSRHSNDPLLSAFLKQFQINLLNVPRRGLEVGAVFIQDPDGTLLECKLTDVFQRKTPPDGFVDQANRDSPLSDIEKQFSNKLDTSLGLSLVHKLFEAFGTSADARLESAYKDTAHVRIKLQGLTHDLANVTRLAAYLNNSPVRTDQTLYREDARLYVVAGVFRAKSIQVEALDGNGVKVAINAAAGLAKASAHVEAQMAGNLLMKYKGNEPLIFGVRLLELALRDGNMWKLVMVKDPLTVLGDAALPEDYCQLGDDVFIDNKCESRS